MGLPLRILRDVVVILIIAAACLGVVVVHDRQSSAKLVHTGTDFTAFYCAGEVVRSHADPYRVEPMRACQQRLNALPGRPSWMMTPVPFPGYVLAGLAMFSLIPFVLAHLLWLYVLFVSIGVAAWALARITGRPAVLIALVLAPPLGLYDIGFGEPTPITLALLALAAERAHARAWRAAAAFVVLAMGEPHLALPAFIGLLLFAPAARATVLAGAAVLGTISLVTIGFAANVSYFALTLPAQAAAELRLPAQFSIPHELVFLHVPDRIALMIGSLAFVVALVAGVAAGRRLERATGGPAHLVLIPPAVALIGGGNYAHENHLFTALGAAVLVAMLPGLARVLRYAPLVLLSVVWVSGSSWKGLLVANAVGVLAALVLALEDAPISLARRLGYGAAIAAGLLVVFSALQRIPTADGAMTLSLTAPIPRDVGPTDDASVFLARRNAVFPYSQPDPRFEAEKIPMEVGLIVIAICAFSRRRALRLGGATVRR